MNEQFAQDMEVDQYSLERGWQEQTNFFVKYMSSFPELQKEKDLLALELKNEQQNLKVFEAEVDLDIRQVPEKYGLIKITEAAVQATVLVDKFRKQQLEKINDIQKKIVDIDAKINESEIIKVALIDRRKALEGLTSLFINNYYSDSPQEALENRKRR